MLSSIFELFKIGVGPSSSHTNGPMIAAQRFLKEAKALKLQRDEARDGPENQTLFVECRLTGSLAFTGKGHGTDYAVLLGLNGFTPEQAAGLSSSGRLESVLAGLKGKGLIQIFPSQDAHFNVDKDLIFDTSTTFSEHPNGLIFNLYCGTCPSDDALVLSKTYFSIGGGFVRSLEEFSTDAKGHALNDEKELSNFPHVFRDAKQALAIAQKEGKSFANLQFNNEAAYRSTQEIRAYVEQIREAMFACIQNGLAATGKLPGGLGVNRRAHNLLLDLQSKKQATVNDWLCAYAMAVNEENASGHAVVTAPTNGAAGVVPAVLYYLCHHQGIDKEQVTEFLMTATLIGSLIKEASSISGAEVGCQGEIGAASAMAAGGCCAVLGGTPSQVENAAEIALEHHLGMTCDPVGGLVQVPCIERNGFGAIKAFAAASLALHGDGTHFISLDNCIAAMKQTGDEMSVKFKETSQGGLAVKWVDC